MVNEINTVFLDAVFRFELLLVVIDSLYNGFMIDDIQSVVCTLLHIFI